MGQLTIDIKALEDRRVDRRWHVLQPKPTLSKKKEEEKKLGKLELAIRWKHNPDRVIQLPEAFHQDDLCLLYTSPSPRDGLLSRMPSSA